MRSHNPNEAITNLSIPERSIPVLLECKPKQRDGFTSLSDVSPEGTSVRRVSSSALKMFLDERSKSEFEKRFGSIPSRECEGLVYVLGLADAINRRDARSLRRVVRDYVKDIDQQVSMWWEVRKSPLSELHNNLNRGIHRVRFVVWWAERERRLAPGLLCGDVATALFTLVLSKIGQPGGLGVCQRSQCRKPFIRLRSAPKQRFCSYTCQAAAGMARYRKRLKSKRK
jgi:hypothetical protein